MYETRGVRGTWAIVGCIFIFLSGCGVQIAGTSKTNGTSGTGGTGGAPAQASIAVTPGSLAFGNVNLNTTATQTVVIASTGTAPLQISAVTINGNGFALSAAPALPLSVAPGATYTAEVIFAPAATGNTAGGLFITSNATNAPQTSVAMSGSGIQAAQPTWEVDLTWQAPGSSADPIAGYNVYRAVSGSEAFGQLNAVPVTTTAYVDATVTSGTWDYLIRSVGKSGAVSGPSNVYTAAIP